MLESWDIQHRHVVLSKIVTPHRIKSNLQVRELLHDAYGKLAALERHKSFKQKSRRAFDIFEELGQAMVTKIAEDPAAQNRQDFTV